MSKERSNYTDGEVLASGELYPNIFVALGFPETEAQQMVREVDESITARAQRDALFHAVKGKPKKTRWGGFPSVRLAFRASLIVVEPMVSIEVPPRDRLSNSQAKQP